MSIIGWIILGLIAGFIASKIVNKQGEGIILDIVLGNHRRHRRRLLVCPVRRCRRDRLQSVQHARGDRRRSCGALDLSRNIRPSANWTVDREPAPAAHWDNGIGRCFPPALKFGLPEHRIWRLTGGRDLWEPLAGPRASSWS